MVFQRNPEDSEEQDKCREDFYIDAIVPILNGPGAFNCIKSQYERFMERADRIGEGYKRLGDSEVREYCMSRIKQFSIGFKRVKRAIESLEHSKDINIPEVAAALGLLHGYITGLEFTMEDVLVAHEVN